MATARVERLRRNSGGALVRGGSSAEKHRALPIFPRMTSSLLAEVQRTADTAGLNLFGLVDAARFDACQPRERRARALRPRCGTLLVLGTGGRVFWQRYAQRGGVAAEAGESAASRLVSSGMRGVVDVLALRRVPAHPILAGDPRIAFARLAEAAGFGTISPVSGLLVHPEYGPWIAVRGAILVDGMPFGSVADASITDRFQPCCTCNRPCVSACPAHVHDGAGNQDVARCASHRHAGNCEPACGSRAACPVGAGHRDGPGEFAHRHVHPLGELRRNFGLGVWRFVPAFLRQFRPRP